MAPSSDVGYDPNEEEDINWKVSNISIRTTLTKDDRVINTKVTQCHMLHMTVVCNFIHTNVRNNSVSEFISQGNTAMKSGSLN